MSSGEAVAQAVGLDAHDVAPPVPADHELRGTSGDGDPPRGAPARERRLLQTIVAACAVLLLVLGAALLIALWPGTRGTGPMSAGPGAAGSTASLALIPGAGAVTGEPVTARVTLVSAQAFQEISVLVDGRVVATSSDAAAPLTFRAPSVGTHEVTAVVRIASGEEVRPAAVSLVVRAGATP